MTIHLVDIDHVGIAVDDLEGSVERYRAVTQAASEVRFGCNNDAVR